MPGPGTRGPQVTGVSCRRGLLRGTWSRHRGPRADRKVGLPAVRTGHLQWCFSPSRGSTPDPQPRHCSRRRCGFRDLGSAAPPVCDGHLDLGRPQRAPLWGRGARTCGTDPVGAGPNGCPLLAARESACAAADPPQGPRQPVGRLRGSPAPETPWRGASLAEPRSGMFSSAAGRRGARGGARTAASRGINHPVSVFLVFFVSLIKLQSPSFEQYSHFL